MFYQWNRATAWSFSNPLTSVPSGKTWDSSYAPGTTWTSANDPCPEGWRVPTTAEGEALVDIGSVWNDTKKGRTFGSGSNTIFLPAVGYRSNLSTLGKQFEEGLYWLSTNGNGVGAYFIDFSSSGCSRISGANNLGYSVRCVKK
jgi:uncharacterized protein (TIGR02145 family)